MEKLRLGRTDLEITPIGLGCMQFSGPSGLARQVFAPLGPAGVTEVIRAALDAGITWFDTAEMYGRGHSETALTNALRACGVAPGDVTIATKWAPMARTARNIPRTIDDRLAALQGYPIDLYQIHEPFSSIGPVAPQLRAMAALQAAGKIRSVGVSNFNAKRMAAAHQTLRAAGVVLASNQVQINLLHRAIEHNGVLAEARRLGVTLIAYSPLAGGVLTGRFHEQSATRQTVAPLRRLGHSGAFSARGLARSAPLIAELRAIGASHGGASVAQTALNWLVTYYGDAVVAIPGASKHGQATEAGTAMDFQLTTAEVARIDELSRQATGPARARAV